MQRGLLISRHVRRRRPLPTLASRGTRERLARPWSGSLRGKDYISLGEIAAKLPLLRVSYDRCGR
jgi:hypothetical protein